MELKTRYQYTNFIHTFVINKGSYSRYMMKLLKDERFELRIFQKEKDLELYTYYLNMKTFHSYLLEHLNYCSLLYKQIYHMQK